MKKLTKRLVSGLLAGAMVMGGAATVFAGGDTMPPREGEQGYLGENQPTYHGHRAYDVLNWTPETDEYADFMRASVPLQQRNDGFQATQANPKLEQAVKSLGLSEDYGLEFFNPTQYNDNFAQYVFNFWQYQDIRASWHGVVTNPTPDSLLDIESGKRDIEFGVLNIPNPAYTNAAHKNGVMSLGCIFFPRNNEHTDDWIYQDETGRFPLADKLVEMCKWYGFDGYFINAEEDLPRDYMPIYQEFCRALTSQGIYVQVYASNLYGQDNYNENDMNYRWGHINYEVKDAGEFANWIKDPEDETLAANSLYMNPDPTVEDVLGSVEAMKALGLDARETVFQTLEAGQTGFAGERGKLYNLLDENGVPRNGLAHLGAGTVYNHLDEQLYGHSGWNSYAENRRGDPEYQKYIVARERAWWSGSLNAPTYAKGKGTLECADMTQEELCQAVLDATFDPVAVANGDWRTQANLPRDHQTWRGISGFISERSVIDGTNFYTSFNTGHGMQYFVDGKVSNENQWSNINDQDILPTWQWWIDTDSENRLDLDFDYGPAYNSGYDNIQVGGYHGSSSLAIFGTVDAKSDIRLYKTDLDITGTTRFDLTYNKPSETDSSKLSLVLYLKDGQGVKTVYLPIRGANKHTNGWEKTSVDLSKLAGETIAAFGISVDTTEAIENYQINLGEIAITDGKLEAPDAPTGFTIDRAFETGEVYLSWDMADYDDVINYNLYAVSEDGTRTHVGATYDDIFYVKDTVYDADTTVSFEITAEGVDGTQSKPAAVAYQGDVASDLAVEAVAGGLNLTWTNPNMKYKTIRAEVTLPDNPYGNTETYTAVFDEKAQSGFVMVPVVDGSRYNLRLSFLSANGTEVAFRDCAGNLPDTYCEPYQGALVENTMNDGWRLLNPQVYDWWHISVWDSEGALIKTTGTTRGVENLRNMPVKGDFGYVEVQLEDFSGNKSERTRVYWGAETKAVDEFFSDPALLAAVKEQVGETMDKVLAFDGVLDLSNTDVVNVSGISYLRNLKGINITGCTKLETLNLRDTSVELLICDDPSALVSLVNADLTGARLDLTEGTPEQLFVEAAKGLTEGKDDISMASPDLSNLAAGGTTIVGDVRMFNDNNSDFIFVNAGKEFVVDMGIPQTVESWELYNQHASWYHPDGFILYASDDNVTYTEVLSFQGATEQTASGALDQPVTARYFKFVPQSTGYCILSDFKLMGHGMVTIPAGVFCENQRPVAYANLPGDLFLKEPVESLDLASLVTYTTVRGNDFGALEGAAFVDPDYDVAAQMQGGYDVIYVDGVVSDEIVPPVGKHSVDTYHVTYQNMIENRDRHDVTIRIKNGTPEELARQALEEQVDRAHRLSKDDYSKAQWKTLEKELKNAEKVLSHKNAPTEQMLGAAEKLNEVINRLIAR